MQQDDFDRPGDKTLKLSGPVEKGPRKPKGEPEEGEVQSTIAAPNPKQIIADAIQQDVVTVSGDRAQGAAEAVLARLRKAGYEVRKSKP